MDNKTKKDRKKFDQLVSKTVEQCHKHLREIIDTEQVVVWADRLDVTKSLISSRWKRDHFPNIPNMIKLLMISGFSANWLLLGIGPKYINQVYDPDQVAADELHRRELTADLFQLEKDLDEKTAALDALKSLIEKDSNSSALVKHLLKHDFFSKSSDEIRSSSGHTLFKHHLLPLITLIQFVNNVCFKLFQKISESSEGADFIADLIKYIEDNMEKNQFSLLASLSDMDRMFVETGLINFLSDDSTK